MSAAYFGQETLTTNETRNAVRWFRNRTYVTGFTCPGSGNQQVTELSFHGYLVAGAPNIRLALYNTSDALLCQGSAEVPVAGASGSWQGHIGAANITPNPCIITGGVQYDIAVSWDCDASNTLRAYYVVGSSGDYTYLAVDYTGGFPDPLADATDGGSRWAIRCGVDPAAGLSIPVAMMTYREKRR